LARGVKAERRKTMPWCILAGVMLTIMSMLIQREETNPECFYSFLLVVAHWDDRCSINSKNEINVHPDFKMRVSGDFL
jgi:hypothetical protein